MNKPLLSERDRQVLILAPRGRDAAVVTQVLTSAGLAGTACHSLTELAEQLKQGAGLAILTEEVLQGEGLDRMMSWLLDQPPWSDLPLLVLAGQVTGRRSPRALAVLEDLGNVTLLERPLSTDTLTSAARAALRARARQYVARQHLEEQARFGREIERLHRAERYARLQALRATETLSLALDAAELGTFHCPMPLGQIVWNHTCKRHFWLPDDAIVDIELFYSLLHPDDREPTRNAITKAIGLRAPYDVEYRSLSPTGETRWLRAKGRAYYDESGTPSRFDGVTIDISAQKALEVERAALFEAEHAARQQAEHASRVKDEFLATLSHELRTPLSAILGWVYLLKQPGTNSAVRVSQAAETIERNARAQSVLIDELLDMSRIIAGNVSLEMEPVFMGDVVEAVIASLQPAAQAKSVRIDSSLEQGLPALQADGHRLRQIVANLLSNALKFTEEGGTVTVRLWADSENLVLEVADSGRGISKDFLPFVFERFRQADGSSTRAHGGLGLGLSIVRDLVELHGGSVLASSEGLGHGATFEVRLPARKDRVAPTERHPATNSDAGEPVDTAPVSLEGVRILLVEDEADGREMLARVLTASGANTIVASSAREALTKSQYEPYDVLISDIGMPGQDGYELLRILRSEGHDEPAIALTAFAQTEDKLRALAAGYALHLSKPVEPPELVAAIRRMTSVERAIGK